MEMHHKVQAKDRIVQLCEQHKMLTIDELTEATEMDYRTVSRYCRELVAAKRLAKDVGRANKITLRPYGLLQTKGIDGHLILRRGDTALNLTPKECKRLVRKLEDMGYCYDVLK